MNIRISPNQLRLRLSQEDLSEIVEQGYKEEAIRINALETFNYELRSWNLDIMEATFDAGKIKICIPETTIASLNKTDLITVESVQKNGSDEELRIIVEKDLNNFRRG